MLGWQVGPLYRGPYRTIHPGLVQRACWTIRTGHPTIALQPRGVRGRDPRNAKWLEERHLRALAGRRGGPRPLMSASPRKFIFRKINRGSEDSPWFRRPSTMSKGRGIGHSYLRGHDAIRFRSS
jgi:hypothetical protein